MSTNINEQEDDDVIMMDVNSLFNGSVEVVEVTDIDEVKTMISSSETEGK